MSYRAEQICSNVTMVVPSSEVSAAKAKFDFAEEVFGNLNIIDQQCFSTVSPGEPLEHWAETMQTDFLGAMCATRLAIEALRHAVAAQL